MKILNSILIIVMTFCVVACKSNDSSNNDGNSKNIDFSVVNYDAKRYDSIKSEDNFYLVKGCDNRYYSEYLIDIEYTVKNGKNYNVYGVDLYDSATQETIFIDRNSENRNFFTSTYYNEEYESLVTNIGFEIYHNPLDAISNTTYFVRLDKVYYWDSDLEKKMSFDVKNNNIVNFGCSFEVGENFLVDDIVYEINSEDNFVTIIDIVGDKEDVFEFPSSVLFKKYDGTVVEYSVNTLSFNALLSIKNDILELPRNIKHIKSEYLHESFSFTNINYLGTIEELAEIKNIDDLLVNRHLFINGEELTSLVINKNNFEKIQLIKNNLSVKHLTFSSDLVAIYDGHLEPSTPLIYHQSFYFPNLETVVFEEGIETIKGYLITSTDNIKYVILPESIKNIDDFLYTRGESYPYPTYTIYSYDEKGGTGYSSNEWHLNGGYGYMPSKSHKVYWKGEWKFDENGVPMKLVEW